MSLSIRQRTFCPLYGTCVRNRACLVYYGLHTSIERALPSTHILRVLRNLDIREKLVYLVEHAILVLVSKIKPLLLLVGNVNRSYDTGRASRTRGLGWVPTIDLSWPSVMLSMDVLSSSKSCWLCGEGRINERVEKSMWWWASRLGDVTCLA